MFAYRARLALRRSLAAAAPASVLCTRPWAHCDQQEPSDEAIFSPGPAWRRAWNDDWDGRHPATTASASEKATETKGRIRHVLLVRHGQYNLEDPENGLTELGREQARLTGKRLADLAAGVKRDAYGEVKISYSQLVCSTVLRAQQTAEIISQELPGVPRAPDDVLLAEGFPVLPLPQGPDMLRKGSVYPARILEEGPRIEAGFRKYIRRDIDHKRPSSDKQNALHEGYAPQKAAASMARMLPSVEAAATASSEHEYVIVICHMNVIRYFVARALQLPPETWLRMRGNNCGITEIIIHPGGKVSLNTFADTGHLAVDQLTFH